MIRTLIVDDELPGRNHLRSRLENERDVEIVGEAAAGAEAVEAIRKLVPDLVFLDVQMPGLDGFGVLREIADFHLPVVVFVTAYDQYAIEAFESNAVDYLLKPFTFARFTESLRRAREQLELRGVWERHQQLIGLIERVDGVDSPRVRGSDEGSTGGGFPERIPVREDDRYFLIAVDRIDYIESARNYVRLHIGPEAHLIRSTLAAIEEKLNPRQFARIHRSTIVNLDRIVEIRAGWHGDYDVHLQNGATLRLSRNYRDRILSDW